MPSTSAVPAAGSTSSTPSNHRASSSPSAAARGRNRLETGLRSRTRASGGSPVSCRRSIVTRASYSALVAGARAPWPATSAVLTGTAARGHVRAEPGRGQHLRRHLQQGGPQGRLGLQGALLDPGGGDRKSTRLNSSHVEISYAVFCLKKK